MRGSRGSVLAPAAPPTVVVGRRDEVAEVRRLLGQAPVVTLTGPPGVGKTRLALHAAQAVSAAFPDGVWFVDLLALTDPGLLAQEVARALGVKDSSTQWAVEGLAQRISDRTMLLQLDNCEHMLDACAVLADSLVRTCPNLRVLATSRQSLGITTETVLRVAPLAIPEEGETEADAVELLLRRAAAVSAGFAPQGDELRAAAELARRLDGIPLAIELAAVRLKTLTVEQVLDRLGRRFDMLAGRDASAPEHHRTLRATLAWSRDLLSEEERVLWRRASVFATGFDLAAAEAICAGDPLAGARVIEALDGLVDKSIVTATRAGTTMRYRLLETLRDYGLNELRGSDQDRDLQARMFAYYAELCRQAWDNWATEAQPDWFTRLAAEHGNLRVALDWAVHHDVEAAAATATDMWLYWEARGHLTEGRRRLGAILEVLPPESAIQPKVLWVAGYLALGQRDIEEARSLLSASAAAAVERSNDEVLAFATQYLGLCHVFAGDVAAAAPMFEQAFEMHLWLGSKAAPFALTDVAVTTMLTGNVERAVELFERALVMNADGGDPWTRSHAQWGLGVAAYLSGDVRRAEQAEKAALELSGRLDERTGIALSLETLAWTAAARGALERATLLQGASLAIWESIPGQLPPPMQAHAARCTEQVVDGLGAERREQAFARGRALDRAAAVALGLEEHAAPHDAGAVEPVTVLSRRENEVALLVAEGLTDREIASRLVISQRTAESHVQHMLSKLGFRSRAQVASWVTQQAMAAHD